MISSQYNSIYIEELNISETNFRSINAENVSMKNAIDNSLTSIDEWRKFGGIS